MGFVYLICDFDNDKPLYKVGVTKNNVQKRLKQLQTGSGGELTLVWTYESEHYRRVESWLHRRFKQFKTNGGKEWFSLPEREVLTFKDQCKKIEETITFLIENNEFFN